MPAAVDIGHHGPGFHDDAPLEEIVADIDRGVRASLAAGITSIVDAQVTRRELNGYRVARERGLLGVRLTAMPISSQLDAFEALGLAGRFGDDRLAIGPMKFYADGALTGGTASFTTPYGPEGEFTGSLYWGSEDDFRDAIARAHAAGWQIGVHAQGDRAIDRVLDAYEAALRAHPREDHRHRIEHCGGPRPDQLERIARLGVMVVGQPRYFWDAGDAWLRVLDPGAGAPAAALPRDDRRRGPVRAVQRRTGRLTPTDGHHRIGRAPDDGLRRRHRRRPGAERGRGGPRVHDRCRDVVFRERPPRHARSRQARGRRRARCGSVRRRRLPRSPMWRST